jgi:hypothetical protein
MNHAFADKYGHRVFHDTSIMASGSLARAFTIHLETIACASPQICRLSSNTAPNMGLGNARYEILLTCADGGL